MLFFHTHLPILVIHTLTHTPLSMARLSKDKTKNGSTIKNIYSSARTLNTHTCTLIFPISRKLLRLVLSRIQALLLLTFTSQQRTLVTNKKIPAKYGTPTARTYNSESVPLFFRCAPFGLGGGKCTYFAVEIMIFTLFLCGCFLSHFL